MALGPQGHRSRLPGMNRLFAGVLVLCLTITAMAQGVEGLRSRIEGLRVAQPAWREIPWRTSLVEGLEASRAQHKPVLLWIFIDRPIDDARC